MNQVHSLVINWKVEELISGLIFFCCYLFVLLYESLNWEEG